MDGYAFSGLACRCRWARDGRRRVAAFPERMATAAAAATVTIVRAIVYSLTGGPDVLELVERPVPEPGPGEVRVRVARLRASTRPTGRPVAGRAGRRRRPASWCRTRTAPAWSTRSAQGVDPARVGERVWLWEAAWQRAGGTAQEYVVAAGPPGGPAAGRRVVRPRRQPRHPVPDRAPVPDRHRGRTDRLAPGRAGRPHRPGRRRRRRRRQRGDPARPVGRRDGASPRSAARRRRPWRGPPARDHVVDYRAAGRGRRDPRVRAATASTSSSRSRRR